MTRADASCKQPKVDLSEGDSNLSPQRRHWLGTAIDTVSAEWFGRDARAFVNQSLDKLWKTQFIGEGRNIIEVRESLWDISTHNMS